MNWIETLAIKECLVIETHDHLPIPDKIFVVESLSLIHGKQRPWKGLPIMNIPRVQKSIRPMSSSVLILFTTR